MNKKASSAAEALRAIGFEPLTHEEVTVLGLEVNDDVMQVSEEEAVLILEGLRSAQEEPLMDADEVFRRIATRLNIQLDDT